MLLHACKFENVWGRMALIQSFLRSSQQNLAPSSKLCLMSLNSQCLPPTLCQASISLLLKKGKDPHSCFCYRPISRLNVDVKILAKVLALRLQSVLPTIVSSDQTGFVKNRHLFFNVRRVFNILYTPSSQRPEAVLALGAEKAFDRVEWNYLFYVLKRFGFGDTFISWVKLLYTSPLASVRTNDTYSSYFPLQRETGLSSVSTAFCLGNGAPLQPLIGSLQISNGSYIYI